MQPLELQAQLTDNMRVRPSVRAEAPSPDVMAKGLEKSSEQHRGRVACEEARQDEHRVPVTAACGAQQRPGPKQSCEIQSSPWRFGR